MYQEYSNKLMALDVGHWRGTTICPHDVASPVRAVQLLIARPDGPDHPQTSSRSSAESRSMLATVVTENAVQEKKVACNLKQQAS
jgi:hypothetical protein